MTDASFPTPLAAPIIRLTLEQVYLDHGALSPHAICALWRIPVRARRGAAEPAFFPAYLVLCLYYTTECG